MFKRTKITTNDRHSLWMFIVISSGLLMTMTSRASDDFFERELTLSAIENADQQPWHLSSLSGFDLDRSADTAWYIDGMPINLPTNSNGQGYRNTNFIIFDLINHSEYKRGAFYAEEGDFSSAGTVRLHNASQANTTTLSLGAGEYGFQHGLLTGSHDDENASWIYGVESVKQDIQQDLSNSSAENGHENVVLKYLSGDDLTGFSMTTMLHQSDWKSESVQQTLEQAGDGQLFANARDDSTRYSLSGSWWQASSKYRTKINAYAIDYDADLDLVFGFFNRDDRRLERVLNRDDSRTIFGANATQEWFQNANSIHTVGLDLRQDDIADVEGSDITSEQRPSSDALLTSSAVFYSYQRIWNDSLRTVLGLRWDQLSVDADDTLIIDFDDENDQQFSPKLQIVLGPWLATEFFINIGHGVHSNDARYSFRGANTTSQDRSEIQLVSPLAETKAIDIGFSSQYFDTFNLSFSLWQLEADSELAASFNGTRLRPSKRKGVELGVSYQPLDNFYIELNGVLSEARFSDDSPQGNYIPGSIEDAALFSMNYLQGSWMTSLYANYYGARPYLEDNSLTTKAATSLDWVTNYQLSDAVTFRFELLNVLDDSDNSESIQFINRVAAAEAFADYLYDQTIIPRTARFYVNFIF